MKLNVAHALVTSTILAFAIVSILHAEARTEIHSPSVSASHSSVDASTPSPPGCPSDMVNVAGRFCVDRFEATVTDTHGRVTSPYYPPDAASAVKRWEHWTEVERWERDVVEWRVDGGPDAGYLFSERDDAGACLGGLVDPDGGKCRVPKFVFGVPGLPTWQQSGNYTMRATSRRGVIPNGYVSALIAAEACRGADKRLCTDPEWVTACRGQDRTRYPYGDQYQHGVCNVFRDTHPSLVMRGDWGAKLSDPRMNLMAHAGAPLLEQTGQRQNCRSRWGTDAIYDMVGNLDEWVEHRGGLFLGGFYSRATKSGCRARVWAHPVGHVDFSVGFRCCRNVQGPR